MLETVPLEEELSRILEDSVRAVEQLREPVNQRFILEMADLLAQTFLNGNKLIVAGNGGSLCDASHFAEELTGFFKEKRRALPAISLSEPGHLTCVGNDVGFEQVFSRGVEAYGKPGDLFVGLTTSGNSPNLVLAFKKAKELGMTTVAFLGKEGGVLKGKSDLELHIKGFSGSGPIQEAHMAAIHAIIELLENQLFKKN